MIINFAVRQIKSVYNVNIKDPAVENPIVAAVCSAIIKIFSYISYFYSNAFGIAALGFSFLIDIALVSNYKEVKDNFEYLFMTPDQQGKRDAEKLKRSLGDFSERTQGFFKGL
ncbi:MAG: hypothetical protein JXA94_05185 [Parachlamydiales bacterium]|nr:hypothetical protein [Parachlamydiales bacterium]